MSATPFASHGAAGRNSVEHFKLFARHVISTEARESRNFASALRIRLGFKVAGNKEARNAMRSPSRERLALWSEKRLGACPKNDAPHNLERRSFGRNEHARPCCVWMRSVASGFLVCSHDLIAKAEPLLRSCFSCPAPTNGPIRRKRPDHNFIVDGFSSMDGNHPSESITYGQARGSSLPSQNLAQSAWVPAKAFLSTKPEMPGSEPFSTYCQKCQRRSP